MRLSKPSEQGVCRPAGRETILTQRRSKLTTGLPSLFLLSFSLSLSRYARKEKRHLFCFFNELGREELEFQNLLHQTKTTVDIFVSPFFFLSACPSLSSILVGRTAYQSHHTFYVDITEKGAVKEG